MSELAPSSAELAAVFEAKYGADSELGWGPRMRLRFEYFNPDDHYEALLDKLIGTETRWLDVGCGRDLFPNNSGLARALAERCQLLVGIDPAPTLAENPFVHERIAESIDSWQPEQRFDLITMRMVAEHVANPGDLVQTLAAASAPGSRLVIYTVNGRSPVPLMTRLFPMAWRHRIKSLLWRTEEKDTFPTCFRMNTRRRLSSLLEPAGFAEESFQYLDDCRSSGRFRVLQYVELWSRRLFRALGMRYPENCLLGVYRRN
ncbi:MAG: class I SAM-dependent methyltransferase [Planctomycetota bacterium]|jgi:SAM-dependent methyltransferase